METSNVFWRYTSVNMSTLVFYQKGAGRGGRKFTPLRRLINKLNVRALIVTRTAFRARKYPWLREKYRQVKAGPRASDYPSFFLNQ